MILSLLAAAAVAASPGTVAAQPVAEPAASTVSMRTELDQARAEIAAQRRRLEAQEARLQALERRLEASTAQTPARSLVSAAPPAAALAQASSASSPGDPATIQQSTITQPIAVGERPADRDRPPEVAVLGNEGSVVTRRGQLTGELQIDYAHADRNRALFRGFEIVNPILVGAFDISEVRQDIITASVAARYGLTDKLELGIRVPVVHRADNTVLVPIQGSTNNDAAREQTIPAKGTGIGDLELSARYQLISAHDGLPFIVGNLQVVIPTGSDPFSVPRNKDGEATKAATGAGFWGVSPSLTAILPSDPAVLFGTIGYTHNFGKAVNTLISPIQITYVKPGDALSFSAGIGVSLNDRTSLNLGYAQTFAFGTRTRTILQNPPVNVANTPVEATSRDLQLGRLLFGVTYRATDRASLNWSVEVGATDDSPDVRSVLRIPFALLSPR